MSLFNPLVLETVCGGRSDGGGFNVPQGPQVQALVEEAPEEIIHPVDAGKNDPVILTQWL
jgi:hypothetical protein